MIGPAPAGSDDAAAFARAVADEAEQLLRLAEGQRLVLRLTGSLAVRSHCAASVGVLESLGRRPARDIDFMGIWKQQRDVSRMFEARGYLADPDIKQAQEFGVKRLIYQHPDTTIKTDVFMDDLVMAHVVPFGGRLELDSPTVSVTDLLLSKLQIHEITENDLIDSIVILGDHDVGQGDREAVDAGYIASIMSKDWGFWYTTLSNLEKIESALERFPSVPAPMGDAVRTRIGALRSRIDETPKTAKWKIRARMGTRVRWYEEVAEVHG
ncbi:MAG TPA: hypothetical protein VEM41_05905 [Actinomycetota bacterium]|nr:hypothetical protein [Actinomycetota bacterium]